MKEGINAMIAKPLKCAALPNTPIPTNNAPPFVTLEETDYRQFIPGDIIGGTYEVLTPIEAGSEFIYKVRHVTLGKEFALKTLGRFGVSQDDRRRFFKEAKALAGIEHPNLTRIYDLGLHNFTAPFCVMELVKGKRLDQVLDEKGALPPGEALDIIIDICNGLRAMHQNGIVHGDIKPANMIILDNTEGGRVKLFDFGMSTAHRPPGLRSAVRIDADFTSTPYYLSPEQTQGHNADIRSDIYAIGCVLFEMLAGMPPFNGITPGETLLLHRQSPPSTLAFAAGKTFWPDLEALISALLKKKPADRIQSVDDLLQNLQLVRRQAVLERMRQCLKQDMPPSESAIVKLERAAELEQSAQALRHTWASFFKQCMTVTLIILLFGVFFYHLYFLGEDKHYHSEFDLFESPFGLYSAREEGSNQANINSQFSKIVNEWGRGVRVFHFPADVVIGDIQGSCEITAEPAVNVRQYLIHDKLTFFPSPTVAHRRSYLDKFQRGDIYRVSICAPASLEPMLDTTANIAGVRALRLLGWINISPATANKINNFKELQDLDLGEAALDNRAAQTIRTLHVVRTFSNCNARQTDAVLEMLKSSPVLEDLNLSYSNISAKGIDCISNISTLKSLRLDFVNLDAAALEKLTTLPKLQILSIRGVTQSNATANALAHLRSRKGLNLMM
jgi:serine/threonine protein kinase